VYEERENQKYYQASSSNILSLVPGAVGVSEAGISLFLIHLGFPAPLAQAGAFILWFYAIMILAMGGCWVILSSL